ncbi:poly [ADP-ribose] polymerase 14-like protein [Labeo rohita]|uniref:Poly [ADP-ribose] polymerase n=1 Tax=Labeo rohita TaxID=84645 RepID=A0A498MCX9_LABRO|nr:poly [ADP-ribose] polymerase 14-like protein [Labeo rohita]
MENYQHAVFFEAGILSDAELGHIHKYFQIKRKSGGGDCKISKVDDNTYMITFTVKEAQEKVLERKDHVIKIEGQEIHISLRRENVAESSKQPKEFTNQKYASAKSVEKVFKLDHYLLRYISECKKANSHLNKVLSALSCTFEINIESEELVVVRDQAAEDVHLQKEWEFLVQNMFENLKSCYTIHFEVDRDKSAILKKNCVLQSENLKIYYEDFSCLTVVVGEKQEVEKNVKFLSGLQDKQQIQQECRISEKQFNLIKEHFELYIKTYLPALKITQEHAGVLLLKGPEKEVHEGEKELLKLAEGIKEKRIPSHHALMTFLESSGCIQYFQNRFQQSLRSPVILETSGSDLLLLSLSDGALEEAAAAVQRDVCLETVRLEDTHISSAFTKLKEDLSEATRQANCKCVKVELKYLDESGFKPKVQLVGYTTEVNTLKNIVLQYKRNHQNHHVSLTLPRPEMAEHFSEILAMAGVKKSSVVIKPTCSPSPCVHLTGPLCEVEDLKDSLKSFLQSHATKRFEVKGPGVQQFFQGEGAETLKFGRRSSAVLILPIDEEHKISKYTSYISLQSLPFTAPSQDVLDFMDSMDNEIHIKVVVGRLEQQQADVFVAPMIQTNMTSTLIGSSLLNKAGQQLQNNFNNAKGCHTLMPGEVLEVDATPALGCSKVLFIECAPKGNKLISEKALRSGLGQVFELSLFHSLTSDLDEIIMAVGGIKLHLVFGDITNETTDAIVNTTNFEDFQTAGVCKDILTMAGPQIQAQLTGGQGGLDPSVVAKSILEGIKNGIQGVNLQHLKNIRIILLKINVFLKFKAVALQIFGVGSLLTESRAAFLIIGHTSNDVSDACRELQWAYDSQCFTHTFFPDDIRRLTQDELDQLLYKVNSLNLQLDTSSSDRWVVKGLKDGVNEVVGLIQDALRRQSECKVREKEQALLFTQVTWCILGQWGVWQKLPKEVNHKLENADVKDGIVDAQGVKWTVDLQKMEARACDSRQVTTLKRLENISDFALPIYWDNMSQSEPLKVTDLDLSSAEYRNVKVNFKRTVTKTVLKIQRIQNINLRRLYEVRKKELENKNGSMGAGEKILYHGTSKESCTSIMKMNFNRSLAGQNATIYGQGTYFAVNASYSANPTYAVPAADGTQCMFVACVLTGYHTQGQMDMVMPPVRLAQDHYDSVVDNMQNPSMFVVFHDCQAYPDYLITFK